MLDQLPPAIGLHTCVMIANLPLIARQEQIVSRKTPNQTLNVNQRVSRRRTVKRAGYPLSSQMSFEWTIR